MARLVVWSDGGVGGLDLVRLLREQVPASLTEVAQRLRDGGAVVEIDVLEDAHDNAPDEGTQRGLALLEIVERTPGLAVCFVCKGEEPGSETRESVEYVRNVIDAWLTGEYDD